MYGREKSQTHRWHKWVVDRGQAFSDSYPNGLVLFSAFGVTLHDLLAWDSGITDYKACDPFIESVWGFSGSNLNTLVELLTYKALLVHVVYRSLTASRELIQ